MFSPLSGTSHLLSPVPWQAAVKLQRLCRSAFCTCSKGFSVADDPIEEAVFSHLQAALLFLVSPPRGYACFISFIVVR
jgi:hypothetical protein